MAPASISTARRTQVGRVPTKKRIHDQDKRLLASLHFRLGVLILGGTDIPATNLNRVPAGWRPPAPPGLPVGDQDPDGLAWELVTVRLPEATKINR